MLSRFTRETGKPSAWRNSPRVRRIVIRTALMLALCVAGITLFAFTVPLKWPALNVRVEQLFEKASGVHVKLASGRLFLSQMRYEIGGLQFFKDNSKDEPILHISRVDVTVLPLPLLMGKRSFIDSITIHASSELDLLYDENGPTLGPKAEFLRHVLSNIQPGESSSSSFPFRSLKLVGAEVVFLERATTETASHVLPELGRQRISLTDFGLRARASEAGLLQSDFEGFFSAGRNRTRLEGKCKARGDSTVELVLAFPEGIHIPNMCSGFPVAEALAGNFRLILNLAKTTSGYNVQSSLTADDVQLSAPAGSACVHDHGLKTELSGKYRKENATFELEKGSISSQMLQANVMGAISFGGSARPFRGKFQASRVGEPYRQLAESLLPAGWEIRASDDSFSVDLDVRGSGRQFESVVGKVTFERLRLVSRNTRNAIQNLKGELDFEPGRLVLYGVTGKSGNAALSLEGAFTGDYLNAQQGDLRLAWKAALPAEDCLLMAGVELQPISGKRSGTRCSGTVQTEGTLEQFVSLADPRKTSQPRLTGALSLSDVSFFPSGLRTPIEKLNGKLLFTGESAQIESLQARLLENTVSAKGLVKGNGYFWRNAAFDGAVHGRFDLAQLVTLLPRRLRDTALRYDIGGIVDGEIKVKAPLDSLEQAQLTGSAVIQGAQINPRFAFMDGILSGADASLQWDGTKLRLERFAAKVNGEPVEASGVLSPERVELALKSSFDLRTAASAFPVFGKWMEMSGPARCDLKFAFAWPDDAAVARQEVGGNLIPLLAKAGERINNAVLTRSYTLDGKIDFGDELSGAVIRHKGMPPARVDEETGKSIPAGDIHNLHGTAILSGSVLKVPAHQPVSCELADTRNCKLSGSLQFRPNQLPIIEFSVETPDEARLDSWIYGWGKEYPHPPGPVRRKDFEALAHISAARSSYKGQRAGPLRVDVHHELSKDRSRRTEFNNIRLQGFGSPGGPQGTLSGNGWIEDFLLEGGSKTRRWGADLEIQNMRMLPLLVCVFKDVRNIDGMITTRLHLRGVGTDRNQITGGGSATMRRVAISRTPLIRKLGQTTGYSFESALFDTASSADFRINDGAVTTRNLALQSRGIMLEMHGSYYLDRRINALMRLNLFETVLGGIPIVDELAKFADKITGKLLMAFRVSGPVENPHVQPVPLPLFQGSEVIEVN